MTDRPSNPVDAVSPVGLLAEARRALADSFTTTNHRNADLKAQQAIAIALIAIAERLKLS